MSSESSNSVWNKLFKYTESKKNNNHTHKQSNQKYNVSCNFNVKKVSLNNILDIDSENCKLINNTEVIINLAYDAFLGMLTEISNFRMKLISLNEILKCRKETDDNEVSYNSNVLNLAKKEYDDLIEFLYQNLLNFIKMNYTNNCGYKLVALFQVSTDDIENETNLYRDVSLVYITCSGIVIDDCIAKIDNIYLDTTDPTKLIIQIGNSKLEINKSDAIDDLNYTKLRETIIQILNDLYHIEKVIDKNIKILLYSQNAINVVKNNIGLSCEKSCCQIKCE